MGGDSWWIWFLTVHVCICIYILSTHESPRMQSSHIVRPCFSCTWLPGEGWSLGQCALRDLMQLIQIWVACPVMKEGHPNDSLITVISGCHACLFFYIFMFQHQKKRSTTLESTVRITLVSISLSRWVGGCIRCCCLILYGSREIPPKEVAASSAKGSRRRSWVMRPWWWMLLDVEVMMG